ncbi:PPC domain-containing protein [Bacillus sp. IT-79MI2]|nr:hypothetical protein BTH41_03381 [Bacillus mycoides]
MFYDEIKDFKEKKVILLSSGGLEVHAFIVAMGQGMQSKILWIGSKIS